MPDAVRLDILRTLREEAGLSQTDMARHCGLQGRQSHQTAGAWERGTMTPHVSRRGRVMLYLWDRLRLRQDPVRFEAVWAILVEEWDWEPINDGEWRQFTHVARTGIPPVTTTIISTVAAPASVAHESSSPPIPFQAPALTPHFVGREALLGQLSEHLLAPIAPRIVAKPRLG